ncbi:MAG: serine peptidase [Sedimenticola sp.]|nr:MAG: serine peptidase [Sedimenticola sp.]
MSAISNQKRFYLVAMSIFMLLLSIDLQARSLPDFTGLVEQNSPAVVNISTKQKKSTGSKYRHEFNMPDLPENSPFNDLFKHFFGDQLENQDPKEFEAQSLGSGFVISEDGYILTNNHVVSGADEILVRFSGRKEYVAEIIGTDKQSDVALLKVDADNLPVVKIGSATDMKVGEWVLAIGSPFGFDHTVTAGIISAKGRSLPNENYVPFIQTDVAINPGNSGGPLFNLDGEVIGINSQIYSRTGGFMGLSFAIPIEMAMTVSEQLKTKGKVSRGWLGVLIQDVTRELADSFGMEHPRGALIARVLPDSPSEKAGLQAGDIILEYNGKELVNSSMLPPLVGSSRIDVPADVVILRDGKHKTVQVNIGELPEEDELAQAGTPDKPKAEKTILGLTAIDISETVKEQYQLETDKGVVVNKVLSGPAQTAGIREGDVIQMINNQRVDNLDEFTQQLEKLPKGQTIAVLVQRRSGPMFLALKVPE